MATEEEKRSTLDMSFEMPIKQSSGEKYQDRSSHPEFLGQDRC